MMLKLKIKIFALLMCCAICLQAQTNLYRYKREIKDVNTTWQSLAVPNEVFKNAQSGLADLRIFGVKGKDTLEVPYILEQSADQITDRETTFSIINQSKNENGFYYTFQSTTVASINQIKLSFKQENFDWKVKLEGSNDNKEWFTVLNDYRILSIKNSNTDYKFTQLDFPTAKYSYFRLSVKANEQPELNAAKILKTDTLKGISKDVPYKAYQVFNDAATKQSIINIDLTTPTYLTYLKINAQSDFDFYRTLNIEYATDSFKTEKGMQYNYAPLFEGTISSLEMSEFNFISTFVSRLRVTIENNDNKPLRLSSIALKGPVYELVGRFDDPTLSYALYYGNKTVNAPDYELKNFENKIPMQVAALTVGNEQNNPTFTSEKVRAPLFENKLWLWCLMGVIIALLGFFGYRMLRS
ncbi:MAG: DUF3999 family protein [Pedobacter sp.]|nr:MAG: DUF3999 family protein [Pedobacter sp.]